MPNHMQHRQAQVNLLRNILEAIRLHELAALQMASVEYQQILRNAIGEEAIMHRESYPIVQWPVATRYRQ